MSQGGNGPERADAATRRRLWPWLGVVIVLIALVVVLGTHTGASWLARDLVWSAPTLEPTADGTTHSAGGDFWAHEGGGYLVTITGIAAATTLEFSMPAEGAEGRARRLVRLDHLLDRPTHVVFRGPGTPGSAVVTLHSPAESAPRVSAVEVRRIGSLFFVLRSLRWVLVALALGAVFAGLLTQQRIDAAITLAVLLSCLVLYSSAGPLGLDNRADNELYVPSALSLVYEGDLDLSEYSATRLTSTKRYRTHTRTGRILQKFPLGTPMLGAPVIAAFDHLLDEDASTLRHLLRIADRTAALFAAVTAALVFLLARALASRSTSLLVAMLFAVATPHWATHGSGLWSSNLSTLLLVLSAWLIFGRSHSAMAASAVALALAVFCRPTAALFVPFLSAFVALRKPRSLLPWCVAGGTMALLIATIHLRVYDHWLPPYMEMNSRHFHLQRVVQAAAGLLVSPNRGLFVFAPVFLLSMVGALLVFRARASDRVVLLRCLALSQVAYVAVMSSYDVWWGGGSYGPRLLAETFPFATVLLIPMLQWIGSTAVRPRRLTIALLVCACAWSAFATYRGATDPATRAWNRWPKRIEAQPDRLWDWRDLQILRTESRQPSERSGR